ncbi:MAG TPA: PilZ domain-containing protein [Bdellovibrionales bacterium]|nr:PilZ domain-containing protein [Bdellovibrionales bacterium]
MSIRGDRERVYSRLVTERAAFTVQIDKKTYQCRAKDRQGRYLFFDFLGGSGGMFQAETIASFSLGPEMYFMKSSINAYDGIHTLDLGADLYKVQRRDNFRLVVPSNYKARFELRSVDLETMKATFPVVDLSGGGLSFEMLYATDTLRVGSHITGLLKLGDSYSKPIVALVKHVRPFGSMGSGLYRTGIQFEEMSPAEHEEIIALVMKIHREAFSKFKSA